MGLDSPAYGDERERAVFMESSAFGVTVGIFASIAAAFIAALLGQLILPAALIALSSVPSFAMIWYAKRRGVDISELAQRASGKSKAVIGAITYGGILLTVAAMYYTAWFGHGVIPLPELAPFSAESSEALRSVLTGGGIGLVGGGILGIALALRKRNAMAAAEAAADAEEFED